LTLDPSVICKSFSLTGQETPTKGQSESITSTNNFINFCVGKTNTDGKQIKEGSCNPCPIGDIPSFDNMPSAKFAFPANGDSSIAPNTAFTVKLNIKKMQTGVFTNAQVKYFAAPQQLNGQGQIIGHTHITIEKLEALGSTKVTDPRSFAFFKGVNDPDAGGVASAAVADGLPAGAYRICSINSAANHQPVIVPVAQHGWLDDCSYFTVGQAAAGANNGANTGANAGNATAGAGGANNATAPATGGAKNSTGAATGANSTEADAGSKNGADKNGAKDGKANNGKNDKAATATASGAAAAESTAAAKDDKKKDNAAGATESAAAGNDAKDAKKKGTDAAASESASAPAASETAAAKAGDAKADNAKADEKADAKDNGKNARRSAFSRRR
jgi:hypothetical protein